MKKLLDKLKQKLYANKRLVLFLCGISLVGLIFGSLFITIISNSDKDLIQTYIAAFINNIQNNQLNYVESMKNTLISNFSFIIVIWLLGISIIGIPIIVFMYFTKSFMIGFSVASFLLKFKFKGLLYAIIYIFPHHLINLILFTLLMVYSMKFSYYLGTSILKRKTIYFKNLMNPYLGVLIIVIIGIIATCSYEVFVVPYLLKYIISV